MISHKLDETAVVPMLQPLVALWYRRRNKERKKQDTEPEDLFYEDCLRI